MKLYFWLIMAIIGSAFVGYFSTSFLFDKGVEKHTTEFITHTEYDRICNFYKELEQDLERLDKKYKELENKLNSIIVE